MASNLMKQKSVIEQLFNSVLNFLFFLVAARTVGPSFFAEFSVIFIGAQIIQGIAVQWILLPIVSMYDSLSIELILDYSFKKLKIIVVVSPFLIGLYNFCIYGEIIYFKLIMSWILSFVMIIYEISRYLLIRKTKLTKLILSHLVRWGLCFLVFVMIVYFNTISYYPVLISYLVSFTIGALIQLSGFKFNFKSSDYPSSIKLKQNELLNLGLANATNTTLVTIVLTKISVVSFGAFQAFRSIANFLPLILQYTETHYSNLLVFKKKNSFISIKLLLLLLLIIIIILSFIFLAHTEIVNLLFGIEYKDYSDLLFFLTTLVFVQSISRLLTVELRLKNKLIAFNYSSSILWISSLFFLIIYLFSISISFKNAIKLLILTAISQLINYCYHFFKNKTQ